MAIISAPHANSNAWDDLSALLQLVANSKAAASEVSRLKEAAQAAEDAVVTLRSEKRDVERKAQAARAKLEEADATLKNAEAQAADIIEDARKRAEQELKKRYRTAMSALGG